MKRWYGIVLAGVLILLILLSGACTRQPQPEPPPQEPPQGAPRLVLYLVVDQLGFDTLERYRPFVTGGLARLLAESVTFTDAHHAHAMTATAPGHATLATGCHPKTHGIVANSWFDREAGEEVEAVEDEEYGESPRRLRCTTIGDWLKEAYPQSRVFAASGKDRGAIFSAGMNADGAFWYDRGTGGFTTSDYYPAAQAPWLEAFNDQRLPDQWFGRYWEPLPEILAAIPQSGVVNLDRGLFPHTFPHTLGAPGLIPDSTFYSVVRSTPYVDAYLVDFALRLLEEEQLGQDAWPDWLGLSFSAMDTVGHNYGPHSPEILDTLLRLDRELGRLLAWVDENIGLDATVISLSADHGVMPMPEYLKLSGDDGDGEPAAHRIDGQDITCIQGLYRPLRERFGDLHGVMEEEVLHREILKERGIDPAEFLQAVDELLQECSLVEAVWTSDELKALAAPGGTDSLRLAADSPLRLYLNAFDPQRSPDIQVQLRHGVQPRQDDGVTHGSPYPYDTHVPWLVRLPGVESRVVTERVETVDVAPALGSYLGLQIPQGIHLDRSAEVRAIFAGHSSAR